MSREQQRRRAIITVIIGLAAVALGLLDFLGAGSGYGLLGIVGGLLMSASAAVAWHRNRSDR
jgi:hypothetical protein